jgi:hypothetical protein
MTVTEVSSEESAVHFTGDAINRDLEGATGARA